MSKYGYKYDLVEDALTGKETIKQLDTDVKIASGNVTASSSGDLTLASFSVPSGMECLIGDVDFGSTAAITAEVTVTYVNGAGKSETITRYIALQAAGFITMPHTFSEPFLAFYNPLSANSTVTVNFTVLSGVSGDTYVGNIAYGLRSPQSN
jgi:hypothetical protein